MTELNGYVKLYRKFIQWGWYKDCVIKSVFLHFIAIANFRDMPWQGRTIKRGQCIIGEQRLADDLGLTRQQVRTAIKKLKSTNEITTETTNKYTVITVVNWEDYQSENEKATTETTNTATNKQPTNNQQITNKQPQRKNDKNDKKEKNNIYCAFFDDLWELYPNKKGKSKVSSKAMRELQELGFEKVKACLDAYINQKPDWQQWQNGSTFFNGGYKDYLNASEPVEETPEQVGGIQWQ